MGLVRLGDTPAAVITHCHIKPSKGCFTEIDMTLLVTGSFGVDAASLAKLDLSCIFASPKVAKAAKEAIKDELRKITFDDQ